MSSFVAVCGLEQCLKEVDLDTLAPVGFTMQVGGSGVQVGALQSCFPERAACSPLDHCAVHTITRARVDGRGRACFHNQTEERKVVPKASPRGDGKDGKPPPNPADKPGQDKKEADGEAEGPGEQMGGDDDEAGWGLLPFFGFCVSSCALPDTEPVLLACKEKQRGKCLWGQMSLALLT